MNLRNTVPSEINQSQKITGWDSPGGPVVKNPPARGHGFNPQSGKIPHAVELLSPCATATEPASPKACASESRGRYRVAPAGRSKRKPAHSNEDLVEPKINKFLKVPSCIIPITRNVQDQQSHKDRK